MEPCYEAKVFNIFKLLDVNGDRVLSREEMAVYAVSVNPVIKFSDEEINAYLDEIFYTYGEIVDGKERLTYAGLLFSYYDGFGDVNRDFDTFAYNLKLIDLDSNEDDISKDAEIEQTTKREQATENHANCSIECQGEIMVDTEGWVKNPQVLAIHRQFDGNRDEFLNRNEVEALFVAINPIVKAFDENFDAYIDEILDEYGETIDGERGLTYLGLYFCYLDGIGDVDCDFATLVLDQKSHEDGDELEGGEDSDYSGDVVDKMGTGDSFIMGPKPFSDAVHIHKKICCLNDAYKVFDNMPEKNTFTWNSSNGPGSSLEFLWDPGRFKRPEVGASTVVRLRQFDEDNGDSSLGYCTDEPELHKVCKASHMDVQMKAFHEAELNFSKQSVVIFGCVASIFEHAESFVRSLVYSRLVDNEFSPLLVSVCKTFGVTLPLRLVLGEMLPIDGLVKVAIVSSVAAKLSFSMYLLFRVLRWGVSGEITWLIKGLRVGDKTLAKVKTMEVPTNVGRSSSLQSGKGKFSIYIDSGPTTMPEELFSQQFLALQGLIFSAGKKVEMSFEKEDYRDAWFPATVLEDASHGSFLVKYQRRVVDDDEAVLHQVIVDYLHIRPSPPHLRDRSFDLLEKAVPLYLSEMAPAHLRGALNQMFQLATTLCIFTANMINYGTEKLKPWGWRLSLGLAAAPAIIMTVGGILLLETPNSLIERGLKDKGLNVLKRIRGTNDVNAEFSDISEASELANTINNPFRNILEKRNRPQLVMAIFMPTFQILTGINSILLYAPILFQSMGFGRNASLYSSALTGAVLASSTLVSIATVDRLGRRDLLIGGGIQMIICQTIYLADSAHAKKKNGEAPNSEPDVPTKWGYYLIFFGVTTLLKHVKVTNFAGLAELSQNYGYIEDGSSLFHAKWDVKCCCRITKIAKGIG